MVDATLVTELQAAIPKLPPLPRTDATRTQVLTSAADANNIFAYSTQPAAAKHNSENVDLEPVWPFNLISDDSAEFAVAKRTYLQRQNRDSHTWSYDAIHAARLGLSDEVPARLGAVVQAFQAHASGLGAFDPNSQKEPYIEQIGVLTAAVNEAIAQDYDGLIRIAPAWPTSWGLTGTVYLRGRSKAHVHFQNGAVAFAVLEAGTTGAVKIRNPWSAQATTQATVIDSAPELVVVPATTDATLGFNAERGHAYLIKPAHAPTPPAMQVTGSAASVVKTLGTRTIGIKKN